MSDHLNSKEGNLQPSPDQGPKPEREDLQPIPAGCSPLAEEEPEAPVMGRTLAGLLFLGGACMAGWALWLAQSDTMGGKDWTIWVMLLLGVGLVVANASLAVGLVKSTILIRAALKIKNWLNVQEWQLACLVFSLPLALVAAQAAGSGLIMGQPWVAVVGWSGAIGLAIAGGWNTSPHEKTQIHWKAILIFLLFVAAAFAVRGIDTTHIPTVLAGDEGSSGLSAVEFLEGRTNNVFRVGWFSFPSLFFFLQSIFIRFLGPSIPALRLLAALAGALTVGCVYLLGRYLYGDWMGVFSAIFLLSFHYHNHFSRIGLNNIWDGLWFVLVLGFMIHGWREERRSSFLWAGLCLGLAQYFYVTSRILVLLPLVFFCLVLLLDRGRFKRNAPGILLMYLVFLVTYLPLMIFYLQHPADFMAPLNRVSVFGDWLLNEIGSTGLPAWRIILRQVGLSLQGFFLAPLQMWYRPNVPLLRPIPGAFFLIGLVILAVRIKDARSIMLWLWVLAIALIGGLSDSTPASQRYVAVAPALALVFGFGVQESAAVLSRLWPGLHKRAEWLYLILVLLIGFGELHFYYFEFTPRSDWGLNNQVAQRLADYLQEKEAGWEVVFFGLPRMGYYSHSSIAYLNPHIQAVDYAQSWDDPENPPLTSDHLIFVLLPEYVGELDKIQQAYPNGRMITEQNNAGQMLYWLYEVPADG